jgi:hypothetical protein
METTEQVTVNRAALTEIEARSVKVNGALLRMRLAIDRGDLDAIANLRALAQELNWVNRKALVAAGAADSCADHSTVPDDDDLPQPADYDLAALSGLPMGGAESED